MQCVGLILAVMIYVAPQKATAAPEEAGNGNAALQLAAKIAAAEAGRENNKQELIAAYEKVYGTIGMVPDRWPALVRRVLVCQKAADQICVRSSMDGITKLGGINALALNHLFEVSRYGMSIDAIRKQLHEAESDSKEGGAGKSVAAADQSASAAVKSVNRPELVSTPARVVAPEAVVPTPMSAPAVVLDPPPAPKVGVKTAVPKSLMQRATGKLSRMAATDAAGFFLDALFILLALSLLLAYLLFSAIRRRREERAGRLHALQEIQRLEELRDHDRVAAEHDIWSEQLKAEVAIEAQKAHAEDLRRMAQQAADETILAERVRASEAIKAEHLRYEQLLQAEKARAAEAIKVEQLKTEESIKSARYRSDQAIDAYDQMAARELVYAHKHNDELQDALNAEQARREAQEMKTAEAIQAVEALKVREKKLLDIIRAEQRVRASEARQAAEKLKAAQQAAIALHASLVATRAMKADLERRADEAAHSAELRLSEARQQSAAQMPVNTKAADIAHDTNEQEPAPALPPATVILKDIFSR